MRAISVSILLLFSFLSVIIYQQILLLSSIRYRLWCQFFTYASSLNMFSPFILRNFFLTMGEFRICIVIGFLIEVIIKPSDLIFLAVDKFIQDVIKSVYIFIVSWSVIIIIERYVAGSSLILFSLLMISKLSQK